MRIKKLFLLFCMATYLLSCSENNSINTSLNNLTSAYVEKYQPPGISISLIKDGKSFWSYSNGFADLEAKKSMDTTVIMNIASISKTITTTAILQLWEQGKLDLDEDVSDIVGFTIRNPFHKDSPITTRQLLTHTSSIADGDSYQESYQCGVDYVSLSDWIKGYFLVGEEYYDSKQNFHSWAPGIGYKYSNVAFGLLGLIVEKVSEQPFSVYCEKHLLEPLEMHSSGWFRKDIDTLRQAKQYTSENKKDEAVAWFSKFKGKQRRGFYELCPYGFFNYPDGLFKTTVQDLSHFMKAVMQKGYYKNLSILKETTVDEMLKLQVENYDIQGLGWKKLNYESFALWGHSGRDPGVRTHLYFHQETGIGILLFQNSHEGETLKLLEAIFTLMLENEK